MRVVQGDVDGVRSTLEQWVETRRLLSQEKRDWEVGRELLEDRIEVTQNEIEALREKIAGAREKIAESDVQIWDLRGKSQDLDADAATLTQQVTALEARVKALLPRFPEPLLERVRQIAQLLPENPEDTELGIGERFLGVVGILNEADKFQREVTVVSEVRQLADGTSAEVTTVYLGLAQAYYVNNGHTLAGVGRPTEAGWSWSSADEAAPRIASMIAILQNRETAAFVRLPAGIQ